MSEPGKCALCGEPMPPGEEMFKYHGYSGDCPKPPLQKQEEGDPVAAVEALIARQSSAPLNDSARAALLWVLWHHQGGSSPVGQLVAAAGAFRRLYSLGG